jgi:hypothetical protein
MEIRETANPVGEIKADEAIAGYVKIMAAEWDANKESVAWWRIFTKAKVSFTHVTDFLLKALDDLIAYVDEWVDTEGADKKATVLDAVSNLYDYVIKEAMPIWMKPFAGPIKNYIVNGMLSPAIDWIVDKYRNGDWRKPTQEEVVAQWHIQAQSVGVPFGGVMPK